MRRFAWHHDRWVELAWSLPAPRIGLISDHMPPTRHMATGALMDSKSAFREATRAAGCVEVGNDALAATPHPVPDVAGIRNDVRQSLQDWQQGYRPEPLDIVSPETRVHE